MRPSKNGPHSTARAPLLKAPSSLILAAVQTSSRNAGGTVKAARAEVDVGAADARGKGDAAAAQVQLQHRCWQDADAPAETKTHNQPFDRSANISPVFLTRPMRGNILVTVTVCSSADRADMASSTKI